MPTTPYSLAALLASSTLVLAACGVLPYGTQSGWRPNAIVGAGATARDTATTLKNNEKANEVVLFALGLIETGYTFGGKNPAAGLDCSGMVSYVYQNSVDMRLAGSAADLARLGKPVPQEQLRPGDLVFFNTRNKAYSHVGIYIGDERFVHAPNSRGKVRTESLRSGWFAARFEEGRTYFE